VISCPGETLAKEFLAIEPVKDGDMREHRFQFLWKDETSGAGGCPALIAGDGGYYVQGKVVDAETRAALRTVAAANQSGLARDEDVIFVPANVLDRLRS
jgi:hypothetical protein